MTAGKTQKTIKRARLRRAQLYCISALCHLVACGFDVQPDKSPNTLPAVISNDNQPNVGPIGPPITDSGLRLEIYAKPAFCCNPRTIMFEAVSENKLQFGSVVFSWDFGDDRTASGPRVEHTYSWAGQYDVELVAFYPDGSTVTAHKLLNFDDPAFVPDSGDEPGSPDPDDSTVHEIDEEEIIDDEQGDEEEEVVEIDDNTQLRCMVNLTAYALSYPVDRWASASLITDVSVFTESSSNPEEDFNSVISTIKANNPTAMVGTYISGGRVEVSFAQYPSEAIAASSIPAEWLIPETDRVNLANRSASGAFADLIVGECKDRIGTVIFLDNIVHPSALAGWVRWEDTCWFMARVRNGLAQAGKRLIANIAVAPWGMDDNDVELLSEAVDGMAFEMPFHASARGNKERTERLIAVYRTWLDAGKTVVLIPVAPLETRHLEAEFVAGLAMLLRSSGDRLHVAWPFFQEPPIWTYWPSEFGPAEAAHTYDGNRIIRQFRNVVLTVDPLAGTVSVRTR